MKTTNTNHAIAIIRYVVAGAGILGIAIFITILESAK